ncbi:DNA primase [Streptomyces sp. NPDC002917]|uniref:DNA primase n=1 Tax=Streptomyces sp. NPDC002917 TaxID=3364671 RepID=UPI003697CCC2
MPRRDPVPHDILGEDRTLGGSRLYVDLVPSTCWGSAARSTLTTQYEWKRIREMVYERAGQACEVCGNTREDLEWAGYSRRLHAHERYEYLDDHVQRLGRLICQCVACDEVTHFGRTSTLGPDYENRAIAQALRVNGWTKADFEDHLEEARLVWEERSEHAWKLDVTVLRNAGGRIQESRTCVSEQWGGEPREIIWVPGPRSPAEG